MTSIQSKIADKTLTAEDMLPSIEEYRAVRETNAMADFFCDWIDNFVDAVHDGRVK